MDFGILGPIEAWEGGRALAIGGAQRRALLARLLLARGEQVAVDQLIDDLWPDRADDAVRATLQSHVSQLRKVVGGDRLIGTRSGYALRVEAPELDAELFEQGIAAARHALADAHVHAAVGAVDRALERWRGPALAGVAAAAWAQGAASRLEGLRAEAVELAIEARLTAGDHAGAAARAEGAVAELPYRETLWSHLVLALYRSGRQADALHAFQRVRTLLREELGIDPTPQLVDLERAILQQAPSLDWVPLASGPARTRADPVRAGSPRLQRAARGPFVGREAELDAVVRALPEAGGSLAVVLLLGEPGAGKTRLAAAAAEVAARRGALVAHGWWSATPPYPHQPFVELVASLGGAGAGGIFETADERDVVPEMRRFQLYAAVSEELASVASRAPLLVVIDDLQWCDPSSAALLEHLLVRLAELPVTLVLTLRPGEIDGRPAGALVESLVRDHEAVAVELGGLSDAAVTQLAEELRAGPLAADVASRLLARTGGNPLLISELVRSAAEDPAVLSEGVPVSLRSLLAHRVERLPARAREVLAAATVAGAEFDVEVVGGAIGCSNQELAEAINQLRAGGLISPIASSPGRFSFNHDLVREVLDLDVAASLQPQLHRRLAHAIEEQGAAGRPADAARHWLAAVRPDDAVRALDAAARAGDEALASGAPADAAEWFGRALEVLDALPGTDATRRCDLLTALGRAELGTGEPNHRAHLLEAAGLAAELADGTRLAEAALAGFRGMVSAVWEVDDERVEVLEQALALLGGSDDRRDLQARLLATLACELTFSSSARREEAALLALTTARETGDDVTLLDVLLRRFDAVWRPADLSRLLEETAEAVRLADGRGEAAARFWAHEERAMSLVQAGRLAEADRSLEVCRAIATRLRQPVLDWLVTYHGSWRVLLAGDPVAAERLAVRAYETARASASGEAFAIVSVQLFAIRRSQGRLQDLVGVAGNIADWQGSSSFVAGLGLILTESGRREEARALLDAVAQLGFADPATMADLSLLCLWTETAGRLGAAAVAPALLERLAPYADQVAFDGASVSGSVSHAIGTLHALMGERAAAGEAYATALAVHEALSAPYWIAATSAAWAGALDPGPHADQLRQRAAALADRHGYAEITRLLHEDAAAR